MGRILVMPEAYCHNTAPLTRRPAEECVKGDGGGDGKGSGDSAGYSESNYILFLLLIPL